MPCVKSVREPDAANPHVRFDERGEETGRDNLRNRASPRLYPIQPVTERAGIDRRPGRRLRGRLRGYAGNPRPA